MSEPSNQEKAQILLIWKAAYENLAENMRDSGMWTISVQNIDILATMMEHKAQELNDSES